MEHKKICQSCGMEMKAPADFGTEANGSPSQEYCCYCYQNGAFEEKDMTLEEMIETSIQYVVPNEFPDEETARKQLQEFFPTLKRWAKAQ